MTQDGTHNGTIRRLVTERGFGFLTGDDGTDYFFHRNAVQGLFHDLEEGQRVSFQAEPGPKGPRASRVLAT